RQATGDDDALLALWPTVERAVGAVLAAQAPGGEVGWAVDPHGRLDPTALLTGAASTYHGLRCAVAVAEHLDEPQPEWELALARLVDALRTRAGAFADKRRFSMDWYYPVLGGALRGEAGRARIDGRWDEFVVPGLGARCVADHPWVTGAETCELALAVHALGRHDAATALVADMQHLREDDGSYWTGLVYADGERWPVERSTWTAAAVVLAVDALAGEHPRADLFPGTALPHGAEEISPSGAATAATPDPGSR
ncbi:MAG TPA: prenyltransferase, partial [Pseudonocardia sp.]|nr:prenyltransferase [Pseudonocardia sp.]